MSEPQTFLDGRVTLHAGDCLDVLRAMPDASVDSVVTDPPYEIAFMGKKWDNGSHAHTVELWAEVLRVLKPGGHLLAFAGTRTYHRLTCAIEDAGFEVRDMVAWMYGTGFPKSHDISKAIDKAAGAEREVVGSKLGLPGYSLAPGLGNEVYGGGIGGSGNSQAECSITAPSTEAAKQWAGWGSALKPALEPICLARKPLIGTLAANVLAHGVGGLNIDGCRIETSDGYTENAVTQGINTAQTSYAPAAARRTVAPAQAGRFPANVITDGSDEVVGAFPETAPSVASSGRNGNDVGDVFSLRRSEDQVRGHNDSGSAARFFYSAKADSNDRIGSKHPTVKPVDLMQYLCRLITPPGGTVLDPFAGTGTTGEAAWREGFRAILIEREAEYQADIARRMALCLAGPTERKHEAVKARARPEATGTLL